MLACLFCAVVETDDATWWTKDPSVDIKRYCFIGIWLPIDPIKSRIQ